MIHSTAPLQHIHPEDAVDPPPAVLTSAGRHLHDLAGLRAANGEEVAQVEAMAMLKASAEYLQRHLGADRVRELLVLAGRRIDGAS